MTIILLIIPTVLFYLILKIKPLYKILFSILFYIILFIIAELFEGTISNLHYNLTDKIGYNNMTDFTRNLSSISDILFIIIISVLLFIIYKTKNKKLASNTTKFFIFIILYYLLNFVFGAIYFKIIDIYGYSSAISDIFFNIFRFLIIFILFAVILFKKKK